MKRKGIGWKIQIARKEAGINQEKLAESIGLHRVTVSRIESGESGVTSDLLGKISAILKKPITYFYEGAKTRQISEPSSSYGVNENTVKLPVFSGLSSSMPNYADDDIIGIVELPRFFYPGAKFIVLCTDKSIPSELMTNDHCLVRPTNKVVPGKIMVLKIGEQVLIKKILLIDSRIEIEPADNKTRRIKLKDVKIIGEVVGFLRHLK